MTDIPGEQLNDVLEQNDKVIVDYWAEWCGPCKNQKSVLKELEDEYTIVMINVESEVDIATEKKIRSLPTLEFYDSGSLKEKRTSFTPKKDIENIVESL